MSASSRFNFPFSAIVSQDQLKLALIISVIDPVLGGVLISGRKGTAKSTCARSLAEVLPSIEIVRGCAYGCNPKAPREQLCTECINKKSKSGILKTETVPVPFVNLPLNATEDNITGGLDFRHAISTGRRRFRPGLLARAHRGIVYVDEINLLDDHLVNLLLDASTSGVNIVEREGISISHPSNFVLIGSMNPEEGWLRPQFLDRFGLCVNIDTLFKPAERLQILKRRDDFENNPEAFLEKWSKKDELQKNNINGAVSRLPFVKIREDFSCSISATALASHTAGHRADIVICRAARAIAAYRGRINVEAVDVRDAVQMALPHRVRKIKGLENTAGEATGVRFNAEGETVEFTDKKEGDKKKPGQNTNNQMHEKESELDSFRRKKSGEETDIIESREAVLTESIITDSENIANVFNVGEMIPINFHQGFRDYRTQATSATGSRHRSQTLQKRGRYVRSTMVRKNNDIALDATLRAAAPYQKWREKGDLAVRIMTSDIREKIRERKMRSLFIFIVDSSGSMGAQLMSTAKGAILNFLLEAYQKRDRVSLVAFRGKGSELILPPTSSVEIAKRKLEGLPTGGQTSLTAGLLQGYQVARMQKNRDKGIKPVIVLITDGRANVSADPGHPVYRPNSPRAVGEVFAVAEKIGAQIWLESMVIDTEKKNPGAFDFAKDIAEHLRASYISIDNIDSETVLNAIHSTQRSEWQK